MIQKAQQLWMSSDSPVKHAINRQNLPEFLYNLYSEDLKQDKKSTTVKLLADPEQDRTEPEGYKHWEAYIIAITEFIYIPLKEKLSLASNDLQRTKSSPLMKELDAKAEQKTVQNLEKEFFLAQIQKEAKQNTTENLQKEKIILQIPKTEVKKNQQWSASDLKVQQPEIKSVETKMGEKIDKFKEVYLIGSHADRIVNYLKMPNVFGIQEKINFNNTFPVYEEKYIQDLLRRKPKEVLYIFLISYECFSGQVYTIEYNGKRVPCTQIEMSNEMQPYLTSNIQKAENFLKSFQDLLTGLSSLAIFVPLCPQIYLQIPNSDDQMKIFKEWMLRLPLDRHFPLVVGSDTKISNADTCMMTFSTAWMIYVKSLLKKNGISSGIFEKYSTCSQFLFAPLDHMAEKVVVENKLHAIWDGCIKYFIRQILHLENESQELSNLMVSVAGKLHQPSQFSSGFGREKEDDEAKNENNGDDGAKNFNNEQRALFVGHISSFRHEQLMNYFGKFGEVEGIKYPKNAYKYDHSRDYDVFRYCFVLFNNASSVERVLSIPLHFINGIRVDPKKFRNTLGPIVLPSKGIPAPDVSTPLATPGIPAGAPHTSVLPPFPAGVPSFLPSRTIPDPGISSGIGTSSIPLPGQYHPTVTASGVPYYGVSPPMVSVPNFPPPVVPTTWSIGNAPKPYMPTPPDERFPPPSLGISAPSQLTSAAAGTEVVNDQHWCEICKVYCKNTPAIINIHMAEASHKKKLASYTLLQEIRQTEDCFIMDPVTNLLKCLLCNVMVSGPENLKQHLDGYKHRYNVAHTAAPVAGSSISAPPVAYTSSASNIPDVIKVQEGNAKLDFLKKRVIFCNIPNALLTTELKMIISACGRNQKLERNVNAGMCNVDYLDVESTLRCERLLHNCSIMNRNIEVTVPYKNSFQQKERENVDQKLETYAAYVIKKTIKEAEIRANNIEEILEKEKKIVERRQKRRMENREKKEEENRDKQNKIIAEEKEADEKLSEKIAKVKLAVERKEKRRMEENREKQEKIITEEKEANERLSEKIAKVKLAIAKKTEELEKAQPVLERIKLAQKSDNKSYDKKDVRSRIRSPNTKDRHSRSRSPDGRERRSGKRIYGKINKRSESRSPGRRSRSRSLNRNDRQSSSRSPGGRESRAGKINSYKKHKRFGSRSPDRRPRRSRSRSLERKHRHKMSRSRSPKRKNRQSRSRSRDRVHRRSRSRSAGRSNRISRSRSTDKKNRRSRSRENSRGSRNLQKSSSKLTRDPQRSPSYEKLSNKRKRSDSLERDQENKDDLESRIHDTDIWILDKENINLNTDIINSILYECDSKLYRRGSFGMAFRFKTKQRARVVYKLLNKFRTPLGRVKLVYTQKLDSSLQDDSQETELVMAIIHKSLKKFQQTNIEKDRGSAKCRGVIDPYSFKTKKCDKKCKINMNCHYFHSEEQKRRNPAKIPYISTMCSQNQLGSCFLSDNCNKCHSDYEFNFHPDRVHKKVCSDWYRKGQCHLDFESPNCCINAHPETPEVLFNDVWHDVYIAELKHTYQYFVGAIQNLRFVNTQREGIYILLVTPSIYMIDWLIEATQTLVTSLKVGVHIVTNDTVITEKEKQSQVLLCTPVGIVRILETPGVDLSLTLAGLILDDVTILLHRNRKELELIGKVLLSSPLGFCRVAVADKVYEQEVKELSSLLYTKFNILGTITSEEKEKGLPSCETIDSILSFRNNFRQDEVSPLSVTQNSSLSLQKDPSNISVEGACQLLMSFCDKIGILGHSLRAALEKIQTFRNDTHKIIESLSDPESQELLVLIAGKFKSLREGTQDKILLAKYIQACIAINFLLETTKLHSEKKSKLVVDSFHRPLESTEYKFYESSSSNSSAYNTSEMYDKNRNTEDNSMSYGSSGTSRETSNIDIKCSTANRSSAANVLGDSGHSERAGSNQLTHTEHMLIQRLLGTSKDHDSSSSLPMGLQKSEVTKERNARSDIYTGLEQEHSLKSASSVPSAISDMLAEIGESLDLNTNLNYEQDTRRKLPLQFKREVFKVAIFGHEYVDLLPFSSGEKFQSKIPSISYQVIKYCRQGAEIFKAQDYSIWTDIISAQPHMIFLILGKNDVSEYISAQELANRTLKIKLELEKAISNVRIVCFGLENRHSDYRWSRYQDILNRCLGAGFNMLISPTTQVDIGNLSYVAVRSVWSHMQGVIEDVQLQQIMLRNFLPK
ncbi:unnamed protein product [Meganyctiphanes norvegica]|uniref:RRM domain-containing protein n=1 Tax=Meganyctiphanes norvegica TaxID=48144 RepID=A0AAV2R7F2_MEGNR